MQETVMYEAIKTTGVFVHAHVRSLHAHQHKPLLAQRAGLSTSTTCHSFDRVRRCTRTNRSIVRPALPSINITIKLSEGIGQPVFNMRVELARKRDDVKQNRSRAACDERGGQPVPLKAVASVRRLSGPCSAPVVFAFEGNRALRWK